MVVKPGNFWMNDSGELQTIYLQSQKRQYAQLFLLKSNYIVNILTTNTLYKCLKYLDCTCVLQGILRGLRYSCLKNQAISEFQWTLDMYIYKIKKRQFLIWFSLVWQIFTQFKEIFYTFIPSRNRIDHTILYQKINYIRM